MRKCSICKIEFPEHLINRLASTEGNVWCCPICALKLRNSMCGLPEGTPFQGEMAQAYYEEAVEYLERKKVV